MKTWIPKGYDQGYNKFLINKNDHYTNWKWTSIAEATAKYKKFKSLGEARKILGEYFDDEIAEFAIEHADRVFQLVAIGGGAAIKRRETINISKNQREKVFKHPNEDVPDFYIANGRQLVFYDKRLVLIDGEYVPAELITDVWTDISWNGIASEGGVDFKNGKKPEALIKRILDMCTKENDWVLDSFAGSGTTASVAHKMRRKWITAEIGDHCHTHIIPRLQKVIDGTDQGGISKALDWQGGGGFRYYKLAPSLLERDRWGNLTINAEYNAAMLSEALCKQHGYTYAPSDTVFWQQGHANERSFLYATTQNLSLEQLQVLAEEVGEHRSLLIIAAAWRGISGEEASRRWPNLTLKKIPNSILNLCEWGKDDYSLNVANLPMAQPEPEQPTEKSASKPANPQQTSLFGEGE